MKKFKTLHNLDKFPKPKGERSNRPSMTLPGQSMSMTEILKRHKNGLPLTGNRVTFYEEEGGEGMTQQEFQRLDLAEQEAIIEQRRDELEQLKQKQRDRERDLKKKEQDAQQKKVDEARKAYEDKLRELSGKTNAPEEGDSTNNP